MFCGCVLELSGTLFKIQATGAKLDLLGQNPQIWNPRSWTFTNLAIPTSVETIRMLGLYGLSES